MPTIDLGGHELWYEVQGQGPPVLFVHALFFDHTIFEHQIEALSERYTTIAVDVRCHGASGCPGGLWSLEEAGQDLVALLDHLALDPVHWVGLSMGGMIGLRVALAHPGRLASLSLLDTSAAGEARQRLHKAMATVAKLGGRPMIRLMMPYVAGQMFSPGFRRSPAAEAWLDRVQELEPERLHASAYAVFDRGSLVDRLGEIEQPCLVLVGEEDEATPPQLAAQLEAGLPNARRALIPGSGHMSSIERPEYVTRLVGGFLDQRSSAKSQ